MPYTSRPIPLCVMNAVFRLLCVRPRLFMKGMCIHSDEQMTPPTRGKTLVLQQARREEELSQLTHSVEHQEAQNTTNWKLSSHTVCVRRSFGSGDTSCCSSFATTSWPASCRSPSSSLSRSVSWCRAQLCCHLSSHPRPEALR